jgi:hypothetical protein
MPLYKQKLKVVEAFPYEEDFNKLTAWFLKNSTHSTLPFFWSGRQLLHGVEAIVPGSYVILDPDKRGVHTRSKEEFETSYALMRKKKK